MGLAYFVRECKVAAIFCMFLPRACFGNGLEFIMNTTASREKEQENRKPVRRRGENMVAEARINRAGGGIAGINHPFQAYIYLMVIAAIGIAVWWASSNS